MPRTARIKSPNAVFHIIVKSISDILLFRDNDDKNKYLSLIKKYQIQFGFKVYAYCLMTTHGHFMIDCNGADLSKFMHVINQCYAQYYNKKYNRHGHVFQDRFKSIIISDEKYLITLSLYIHKNPMDMKKYKNSLETYPYSSLGIYLGTLKDKFGILDEGFIMQLFDTNAENARKSYLKFVYSFDSGNKKILTEFEFKKSEYRSERIIINKNFSPTDILNFMYKYSGIPQNMLLIKHSHKNTEFKALFIFLIRNLCNLTNKDICEFIGNITQSRVSNLCSEGINLVMLKSKHKNIVEDCIKKIVS